MVWLFWTDLLLVLYLGCTQLAGSPLILPFLVNVAAVIAAWYLLPWQRGLGRRRALSLLFLVVSLGLGVTGAHGQQLPLVLLGLAALAFTWGVRVSVAFIVVIAVVMTGSEVAVFDVDLWASGQRTALFGASAMFVLGMVSAVEEVHRARSHSQALILRIRDLAIREERGRLAGEMHDSVGHHLMGIKLSLENALRLRAGRPEAAWEQVQQAKAGLAVALVDVRRAIRALGPLELAKYPLEEALAGLVASFRTSGLAVSLTVDGDTARLGAEQELVVFRTVQEALVNVVRHSGADRAQVRLECAPDVRLTIADNGRGAPENVLGRGFGLTEIRRRARSQAGHLQVDGRNGVLLTLRLPSGGGR